MTDKDNNTTMLMGIGAVSRACGVPLNTLRTWERRYGFPNPERTSGKHRQYSSHIVERLVLIRKALELGHRPRNIVPASVDELQALLGITLDPPQPVPLPIATGNTINDWIRHARELDGYALDAGLRREQANMSLQHFVLSRLVPYIEALGLAWEQGHLEPYQEHFATERVRDFLATAWRQLEESSRGPSVICATLPGEQHRMGMYLSATIAALRGLRVVFLGGESGIDLIVAAAKQRKARAVLVSVSVTSKGPESAQEIRGLRAALPSDIALIIGGEGAPKRVANTTTITDLATLSDWADQL